MLLSDGVTPSNEGRGYILRRLMRRAIRAMRLLGVEGPTFAELFAASRDAMKEAYPVVEADYERLSQYALAEEATFLRTLAAGSELLDESVARTRRDGGSQLTGSEAFLLHDTYGFPIDLTMEMASEQGLTVDRAAFDALMKEQKDRARADARAKKGAAASHEAYRELREAGEVPFLGYSDLTVATKVRGIIADGAIVDRAEDGSTVEIVLQETPFYAEAGGQDADRGTIIGDGFSLDVLDVQRPVPGLAVHRVQVLGELPVGAAVDARVDAVARHGSCQAHTATHIVHAALRQLVGSTATQAGSYNKPGYLRFDFSSGKGLSEQLKAEVEGLANEAIAANYAVTAEQMPLDEAKALGAMAMFGEKYPPIVRMVELAGPWSRELCGGTHVATTAEIGVLNLLGESSIGSGVRRVEALVSTDAFAKFAAKRALVNELTDTLRVQPDKIVSRVEKLVAQLKEAEKKIAALNAEKLLASSAQLVTQAEDLGGVRFLGVATPGVAGGELRTLAIDLRERLGSGPAVVVLVGGDAKPTALVATNEAARGLGLKAGQLISLACAALGGKGGGKDDLAQGGGVDPSAAPQAIAAVRGALEARG